MVASPTAVFAATSSEKQNGRKVAAPTGRKHSQRTAIRWFKDSPTRLSTDESTLTAPPHRK